MTMLFDPVILKVSAQYGGFFINVVLLYFALPVVLCTIVGAACGAAGGLEVQPGRGVGVGLAVGLSAVGANIGFAIIWSMLISDFGDAYNAYIVMPLVIAFGAAVLTGILARRATDDL